MKAISIRCTCRSCYRNLELTESDKQRRVTGSESSPNSLFGSDLAPRIELEITDFGVRIFTVRNIDDDKIYFRTSNFIISKEKMNWIKTELHKEFVMALKDHRLVALSEQDKAQGRFVALADIELKPGQCRLVYLKVVEFPMIDAKQLFTNQDGSTGILYLVSSDTTLTYDQLTTIYH